MNSTILYTLVGYSLITSSGYCSHVNGGLFPTHCYSDSVPSQSDCEQFCTSQTSCIGYMYKSSSQWCFLIPSDSTCPSNFIFRQNTHTATTTNDLVAYSFSGYVCYGKNSGKISKLQMSFIYFSSHIKKTLFDFLLLYFSIKFLVSRDWIVIQEAKTMDKSITHCRSLGR